ncbi:hypothetical protein Tco_0880407 [Tanacetum coccineum]
MSTPSNNSQMHNDIMEAGLRERPPMLASIEQETYANTTRESRKLIDAEAEAIHMTLNGIGDDIYSTMDTCSTARKMWLAIEHLQQGESINKQDIMNEMVRIKLKVDTMEVNVQFLQQLQPEWSRAGPVIGDSETVGNEEEKGVPLSEEQGGWLADTDDEPDEQELEAHYINVFPDSSDMCDNEGQADQNSENPEDERVLIATLIANFKLDLAENKKSQRQLKKANTSITQELNKSKQDLKKTKQDIKKSKQDLKKLKQDLEISKQN